MKEEKSKKVEEAIEIVNKNKQYNLMQKTASKKAKEIFKNKAFEVRK